MGWQLRSVSLDEVEACKAALQLWQDPRNFREITTSLTKRLRPGELPNVSALRFLREAWILSHFAMLSGAEGVRLGNESFPDGFVRTGEQATEVELTEAIMPDRRRGLEFLPGTPQIEEDPFEEWTRRLDALPAVLTNTVQKKADKIYSGRPALVVYLNISAFDHREAEMIAAIRAVLSQFAGRFGGLHVLWQGRLYSSPPAQPTAAAATGL